MPEIIPVIISKNFNEIEEKIKLVENFVKTIQLDVADGVFVNNITWQSPEDLEKITSKVLFEAHLMVAEPYLVLKSWLDSPNVCRIILHWEAPGVKEKIADLSREVRRSGKEFGLGINLETPISVLDKLTNLIDLALLMGVNTGFGGQTMNPEVINKIVGLKQKQPKLKIEADGGVNQKNIYSIAAAGADYIDMGSAIFASLNPEAAIKQAYEEINGKSPKK